jgi:predicted TIM-barrel fold metal-dependent hydrolase
MGTEKLIVVSGDSHATLPPDAWPDYVEAKYQHLLPESHQDNAQYLQMMNRVSQFPPDQLAIMDKEGRWAAGRYAGAWDLDCRIAEMDRDGVTAELVYPGDPRSILPLSSMYRRYPQDVFAAGTRAYHRWLGDVFGPATDRLLLVGDPTSGVDMPAIMAELDWMAEHKFRGALLANVNFRPTPPLHDPYWDPYWAKCVEYGIAVVVHAGYGSEQGEFMTKLDKIRKKMEVEGGTDLLEAIMNNTDEFFALDLRPRRAMWQLMLGGVFDRHPRLGLLQAEIRADWLPSTLAHLDASYERIRGRVPAKRRPSEYWRSNCLTSFSFPSKGEVALRHEIGVETITFGRDYPHAEGTWPNTAEWMSGVFEGVSDAELKLMLGENAIRFLGLDRAHLAKIANRIGPTVAQITGKTLRDQPLIANLDTRGGFLKPIEIADPVAIDALLLKDVEVLSAR